MKHLPSAAAAWAAVVAWWIFDSTTRADGILAMAALGVYGAVGAGLTLVYHLAGIC